jgi:raffinose/stachyose/melibiose transport system permease protein
MTMRHKSKRSKGKFASSIFKNVTSVLLVFYSFVAIFLIGNTILSSFKTKSDLIHNTVGFPKKFTLDSFYKVLVEDHFPKYFSNSIILVILSLILLILIASMTAYGISQYEFKFKKFLESYFLLGLMFPLQLGILPLFIILTRLHLNNSLWGLALLYTANMSFAVFIFSNFFKQLPKSVIEYARIDGASEFKIYAQIIIPISKPVIFTVAILNFVQIWNDFYLPLVFLTKSSVKTLTLAVYSYSADFLANWDKIFAAATIALIPLIIFYFFFSEQIIAGLTNGAVKE